MWVRVRLGGLRGGCKRSTNIVRLDISSANTHIPYSPTWSDGTILVSSWEGFLSVWHKIDPPVQG